MLTCILSMIAIAFWIWYISYDANRIILPLDHTRYYQDIYQQAYIKKVYTWIAAMITFVLAVRLLKQLEASRSMKLLQDVLAAAFKDTQYLIIMLICLFLGFNSMAYLCFGHMSAKFHDFGLSALTCFEMIIGEFDYKLLDKADPVMAPIFFFPFIIIFVFILINIFLAILYKAYKQVKENAPPEEPVEIIQSIIQYVCRKKFEKGSKENVKKEEYIEANTQPRERYEEAEEQAKKIFGKIPLGINEKNNIQAWAQQAADAILYEMDERNKYYRPVQETLNKKKQEYTESELQAPQPKYLEEKELKERLNFWDYVRVGYQYIQKQTRQIEINADYLDIAIKKSQENFNEKQQQRQEILKSIKKLELELNKVMEKNSNLAKFLEDEKKKEKGNQEEEEEEEEQDQEEENEIQEQEEESGENN